MDKNEMNDKYPIRRNLSSTIPASTLRLHNYFKTNPRPLPKPVPLVANRSFHYCF